jgi:hypothetical protein
MDAIEALQFGAAIDLAQTQNQAPDGAQFLIDVSQ